MTNQVVTEVREAANYVSGAAEYLLGAGPAVITVVACLALGYLLKATPFPNKYIPPFVWLGGAVLYPLLESPAKAPPSVSHPMVLFAIVGLVLGIGSWVIHRTILRRFLDPRWFKEDGDTMMIDKPKNKDETLT